MQYQGWSELDIPKYDNPKLEKHWTLGNKRE